MLPLTARRRPLNPSRSADAITCGATDSAGAADAARAEATSGEPWAFAATGPKETGLKERMNAKTTAVRIRAGIGIFFMGFIRV